MQSPPSESIRLFIAIELPAEVRASLDDLQKRLRALDRQNVVRWVALDSMHVTLKFMGDTGTDRQPAIEKATAEAVSGHAPFTLNITGAGGFPDLRKPRVIWAGVGGDTNRLLALRDAVERTVTPLGFLTDTRPFSAHITLARSRQESSSSALTALGQEIARADVDTLSAWRVEGVSLMKSELGRSGAVYTRLYYSALQPV